MKWVQVQQEEKKKTCSKLNVFLAILLVVSLVTLLWVVPHMLRQNHIIFLGKGDSYLNHSSSFRGIGIGFMLPNDLHAYQNLTIKSPIPQVEFLNMTIEPLQDSLNQSHFLHVKKVFSPYHEVSHKTLGGYEFVTNINNSLFTLNFRVPKFKLNEIISEVGFWVFISSTTRGYFIPTKLYEDEEFIYYRFRTSRIDNIIITDKVNKCVYNENCN